MRAKAPGTPVVVMSQCDSEALGLLAVQEGAQDYLVKRDDIGELLVRSILYAIERKRVEEALRQAKERAEFSSSRIPVEQDEDEAVAFLQKPFDPETLVCKVREVLDSPACAA